VPTAFPGGLVDSSRVEVVETVVPEQVQHKGQERLELADHLREGAEDMGVVLGHAPYSGEAMQRPDFS